MTSVYISSTFNDLKDHREAVARVLRQSGISVIAMEDYVASDERPLERCLEDVRNSDIYVGLFAHRYGFIPKENNEKNLSITELEYRQAMEAGKPCLIFLLEPSMPWVLTFVDTNTGDGENGQRIRALRAELGDRHMVSFFRGPEDLAGKVVAAVAHHQQERLAQSLAFGVTHVEAPQARELRHHLYLAYLESEAALAKALPAQLGLRNRSVISSPLALLAQNPADLSTVENGLRQCHAAAVLLSAAALARLQEQPQRSMRLLSALRSRAGCLIALCRDATSLQQATSWGATDVLDVQGWDPENDLPVSVLDELDRLIAAQLEGAVSSAVGLPFIVIAMERQEAEELVSGQIQVSDQEMIKALRELLEPSSEGGRPAAPVLSEPVPLASRLVERYGATREEWRPFGVRRPTIQAHIREIVDNLNKARNPRLRGRFIKVQHYSFDPLIDGDNAYHQVYRELVQGGCILIVDELSLLHPRIGEALLGFPFFATEPQVSVVSISPLNPYESQVFHQLESKLSQRLSLAYYRFERDYDPKCELSVGDDRRLKRWFYSSLPAVLQDLREPVPDSNKLRNFAQELGREIDHQMARELYTKGPGL